ncbi:hypothetical protein H6G89_16210 [Oscillatoria sp. FACHB-1407]|uniref:tetratricopeptide repeat protein n=1 Tax=Oscillatoria sp. FACHB-1407 TaxID=2692847 RepID=UPI001681DEA0|nr:tetratricopeptide repeat protein [Oscillatoria sp. FACHB-1407]MBD2462585.1 hypothetical protein [Oscillatoria sp. FACHB-1407]
MVQFNIDRVLQKTGALLGLSLTIASTHVAIAPSLTLAQVLSNSSAPNCQAERQQTQEAALNALLVQAEQAIASGQADQASRVLLQALQQLRAMPNSPIRVSLLERLVGSVGENVAYTSPLDQLVRAVSPQRPQAALAVLSAAFDLTRTVSNSYSASKTRTLIALANDYAQLRQPDQSHRILTEALTTSNTIQGAEFKAIALIGIAEAYVNAEQRDRVAPILERSLQSVQAIPNPNAYRKAAAIERIASLYAQIGQVDRALQVARLIEGTYQPNVTLAIANQYAELGQIDRALEVLQSVRLPEQKAPALAAIAGRVTAQQPQRAAQLYTQAVTTARASQNAEVLATVALRYVEAGGLVATADETIQAIANPGVQAPALGAIALAYARAGQEDRADARLTQAIERLGTIPEGGDRLPVLQRLIDQAAQSGRYDYALRIAETIQPGESAPFERVEVLTQLAERAIAAHRHDAALQIIEQIPPSFASWRDRLYPPILRELVQTESLDQAIAIAQQETADPSFQPRMLAVIAAQAKRMGQTEQSTTLFNRAIQLANQIDYASTQAEVLGAIAQAYLTAGQPEQATQWLNQTIATAQAIEDVPSRSHTLRTIAEQLTFANYHRAAIQVAEAIPDASERLAKLNEAMEKAIHAGDVTTLLTVLNRLDNPVLKTRWLIALADRHRQFGEVTQARTMLNQALQTARTVPGNESQMLTVRGGESSLVVEDDQDRGSFLMAIAVRYAQMGQLPQAQQIVQMLESTTLRQQLTQQINCYR